jgi:prefoldin subunit 4
MIHKEDETEVEVTWEDQQMINTFGRLNGRYHELAEELRGKKDELATVEDASSEIFLIDDEDLKVK